MGRILAIDYGSKRVGLAVTDTQGMIANPLTTVHSTEVLDYMDEYMNKEEVDEAERRRDEHQQRRRGTLG